MSLIKSLIQMFLYSGIMVCLSMVWLEVYKKFIEWRRNRKFIKKAREDYR
jgi:hypothetical protein